MPFIPTPYGIQANMRFLSDGQQCEFVFHNVATSPEPTPEDLQDAAAVYAEWWVTALRLYISSTTVLHEIYMTDVSRSDGLTYTYTPTTPVPGAASGAALPNNCALVITKRTPLRGRSYRGRTYLLGIPEGDVAVSAASAEYVTNINTAAASLLAELRDSALPMAVRSLQLNGVARSEGVLIQVTEYACRDNIIDSQRRRLPGRGR